MKSLSILLIATLTLFSISANAGFEGLNQGVSMKIFNRIDCSAGMSCTKVKDKFVISKTGGLEVLTAATATTIVASQCSSAFYNTAAVQIFLPLAANVVGCSVSFITLNASNFDVKPTSTDQILAITAGATFKVRNATVGNVITLRAVAAGKWVVVSNYGTWTDAGA